MNSVLKFQNVKVLNRIISIFGGRVECEADPKHTQLMLEHLGLQKAKAVATPVGIENAVNNEKLLDAVEAKLF